MSTAGSEPDHEKVRGTRERTPVLSDSPSPPSFDVAKMTITKEIPSKPQNHSDAKLMVYAHQQNAGLFTLPSRAGFS